MRLKQHDLGCLAPASSRIADQATRTAVIVDPQRDIDQYLHDASEQDFHIRYVFLTHFHADFLATHLDERPGRVSTGARRPPLMLAACMAKTSKHGRGENHDIHR